MRGSGRAARLSSYHAVTTWWGNVRVGVAMTSGRRWVALPTGRVGKWVVVACWLAILVVAGSFAGRLGEVQENDAAAYLPDGAESLTVADQQERFPGADVAPAIVVYHRASGITAADRSAVVRDAKRLATEDFLKGKITGPIPSKDGAALQLVVPVSVSENAGADDPDVVAEVNRIREVVGSGSGPHGQVTGPAGLTADQLEVFGSIEGTLLYVTVAVVIAILLLVYRSPFLWALPLLCAGVALATAEGANYLLARYAGVTVSGQSAGILTVLVLGAGTDYALLLIARYREELHRHEDRHEAMAVALHRAGPAILASGTTVILALICLLFARLNSTSGLGPVAAVGIAAALLAMVTLLPALLVILGRWLFWPFVPRAGTDPHEESGLWSRISRGLARRPRTVWIGTALGLGVMCLGLVTFDGGGLNNQQSFATEPESISGQQVLTDHFGIGTGNPAVVIGRAGAAPELVKAIRGTDGVGRVERPVTYAGLVRIDADLTAAPDSQEAFDAVDRLRSRVHEVPGADAHVGGQSAVTMDVRQASDRDTRVLIPIVLAVVFCVLALLLRALVAPVVLILTVGLSYAAALGVCSFAFEHVFGFAGEDISVLIYSFIFLVALGIDYNIFLMTRVREESGRIGTRPGVVKGVAVTGGVITSAGVVLAATFTALTVLPLVAFIEIGVTVAFGVLLDTLIVRSVLVPALTLEIGRRIWWPGRLARVRQGTSTDSEAPEPIARHSGDAGNRSAT